MRLHRKGVLKNIMTRQKQRKTAFQLIYSLNYQGIDQKDQVLKEFYAGRETDEVIPYIDETVFGVCEKWSELDAIIQPALVNWSMDRISAVCMAILRLAVYEIKFNDEIPVRVAINEAIELAKEFGEDDAGSFVHGVLGQIAK